MISFHWYGFLIGLGILGAFQVSLKFAKTRGIKEKVVEKMAWWVIIGGLIGARIYHVVDLWNKVYKLNPVSSLYIWNGGLGIWGGILGGLVGLIANFKFQISNFKTKVKLLDLMDVAVIGVPLGQAIGRLGNWVNGELYGKNGEPLFAWEAGLNLLLFLILWRVGKLSGSTSEQSPKATVSDEKPFAGKITGAYLIGYGLIRILLENFRPEEIIWRWYGIPMAIIMGVISLLVGGLVWKGRRS